MTEPQIFEIPTLLGWSLDLIGFTIRYLAWTLLLEGLIAPVGLFWIRPTAQPILVGAIAVTAVCFCVIMGLALRWLSKGVVQRRRARICLALFICLVLLFSILVGVITRNLATAQRIQFSVYATFLLVLLGCVLYGLVRGRVTAHEV
jgi:hypothetical protein